MWQIPPLERRGKSFDSNSITRREKDTARVGATDTTERTACAPSSARGNFAFPRAHDNEDHLANTLEGQVQGTGGREGVPGNRVAAFAAVGSVVGDGPSVPRGEEQAIPKYVPLNRHGSRSHATHRRTSSRSGSAVGDIHVSGLPLPLPLPSPSGDANDGAREVSRRRSRPQSPLLEVRSPTRVLPPVPVFPSSVLPKEPVASPKPPPQPLKRDEGQRRLPRVQSSPEQSSQIRQAAVASNYSVVLPTHDASSGAAQAMQSEFVGEGDRVGARMRDSRMGTSPPQVTVPRRSNWISPVREISLLSCRSVLLGRRCTCTPAQRII